MAPPLASRTTDETSARRFSARARWFAPTALVVLIALAQRALLMPGADVAWLLTVAEKALDGQRLYIDVVETNPPFAVYFHMPAVVLAHWLGLRAELVFDGLVFALAAASLLLGARILRRAGMATEMASPALLAALAAVLLILPAATFGQREHVALIAVLPYIAAQAARASGRGVGLRELIAVGLFAGLALLMKPYFALGLAPIALIALAAAPSIRLLFAMENIVAAIISGIYFGWIYYFEPGFWSHGLPLALAAYLPVRYGFATFMMHFASIELGIAGLLALALIRPPSGSRVLRWMVLGSSLGFFAAVALQGKGIAYQFLPPLGLALILAFDAGLGGARQPMSQPRLADLLSPPLVAALVLFALHWPWFNAGFDMRGLVAPVRAIATHPRVASIGYDVAIGPPVARALDGIGVETAQSQWASDNVHWLIENRAPDAATRRELDDIETWDRQTLASDLRRGDPDVILIQRGPDDWLPWASANAEIATVLAGYQPGARYKVGGMRVDKPLDIELWKKRPVNC